MPPLTTGPLEGDKLLTALPKGKACLACRRRKVKCDAKSPCTNCVRMSKECIYEEEWERVRRLQGEVDKLERKLEALQGVTSDSPSPDGRRGKSKVYFIEIFFEKSRSGFKIHKPRFMKSLSLPPRARPHPALLNVISLIACHHSNDATLMSHQNVFLDRTRSSLQAALKDKDRLLNFLSASALLAYYFLRMGRFLEAAYQISTTVRFAMACNLHKITTAQWRPRPFSKEDTFKTKLHAGAFRKPILPPPIDAVDLGERINLFWMIILVDHSASLITGLPSSVDYEEIETVWPKPIEDYESGVAVEDTTSMKSLFDVGPGTELPRHSASSDHYRDATIKSIVLLERVNQFANIAKGLAAEGLSSDIFLVNFQAYHAAITRFADWLPEVNLSNTSTSPVSPSPIPFSPDGTTSYSASISSHSSAETNKGPAHKLLLPRTYCLVASIHLYNSVHRGLHAVECIPGCYLERLKVARTVLQDIRDLTTSGVDFRQQLMMQGFAWGAVTPVFVQHVRRLQKELPPDDPSVVEAWRQQ